MESVDFLNLGNIIYSNVVFFTFHCIINDSFKSFVDYLTEQSYNFIGQKKANSKSKKNQIKRNAAKKIPTNSFGDALFDKTYQIMEKHKEVSYLALYDSTKNLMFLS